MPVPETETSPQIAADDEAALVEQLAAFDPAAWQSIFDQYFPALVRFAYVRTFQVGVAEDIAAEVFAEAAKGIGRYRYQGIPFRAWLYRIARNTIADHLKAQNRRGQVSLEDMEGILEAAPTDLDLRADFVRALNYLNEDQRMVVVLRFVSDCSLREVAEVLAKSEGAIKQLQHRALTILKTRLAEETGSES